MAAKRSRKRKHDQIKQLGDDVHKIRSRRIDLFHKYIQLIVEVSHWSKKVSGLGGAICTLCPGNDGCRV